MLIGCHRVTVARAEADTVPLNWRCAQWLDVLDKAAAVCHKHSNPDGRPWVLRSVMSGGPLPWRWYSALRLVCDAGVEQHR